MNLADFWARYEIAYGKGYKEEEPTDDDFDNETENLKSVSHHSLKVKKSTKLLFKLNVYILKG